MFRTFAFSTLVALSMGTASNAAQTHQVMITGYGFFPIITYLHAGDRVVFYNDAETDVNVLATANDSDDPDAIEWDTGDIQPGTSATVQIVEESLLQFEMFGQRWVGGEAQGEGEAQTTEDGTSAGPSDNGGGNSGVGPGYWEDFSAQGEFTFDHVHLN